MLSNWMGNCANLGIYSEIGVGLAVAWLTAGDGAAVVEDWAWTVDQKRMVMVSAVTEAFMV